MGEAVYEILVSFCANWKSKHARSYIAIYIFYIYVTIYTFVMLNGVVMCVCV